MNSSHPTRPHRSFSERPQPDIGSLLYDRASLDGLECSETGWDEWDTCVAEQDLRLAIAQLVH